MQEFVTYLNALKHSDRNQITEHTHRKDLQILLESVAQDVNAKIKVIHEPKRLEDYGAPDFKVTQLDMIIGYVENKKIGEKLDAILKSEQITRYKSLSGNILLTDYLEWIWLKNGKIEDRKSLCYASDLDKHSFKPDPEKTSQVRSLIQNFFSTAPIGLDHPKKLATALAARAQLLKTFLWNELTRQEKEDTEGRLFGLYNTFKNLIDHELKLEDFTDTFAQMLVYGLFMARLNSGKDSIDLYNVEKYIPTSFELIRELVSFLKELEKPEYSETRWIVEEVLTVLNSMDSRAIMEVLSFNAIPRKSKKVATDVSSVVDSNTFETNVSAAKDPYIYFYEDFLAAYDKKLRKAKGVYYTPLPVVNFIVRAIDDVLKDTFKIEGGLADHKKVTVLDFACGTGTFILEIVRQILENSPPSKHDLLIKDHILKNIYGFEYMIAPYTVAHLKLSQYLKDKGYKLTDAEHFNVFLTNTLEHIESQKDMLLPALSKESKSALKVKDKPILVITGNPPYSYVSKNNGEFISKLIKDYYFVDGKPLGERNPKGLQDDYVKFIRFAQWKMQNVDEGIVAIITNHSFLDNPTFRGMRQSLMQTFNQMYFLDLHGNSKKKEKAKDGSKDENVFDIEQGVCISILIKISKDNTMYTKSDMYGLRERKYNQLLAETMKTMKWKMINSTFNFQFINQDSIVSSEYYSYKLLSDFFFLNSVGIATAKDFLAIQDSKSDMIDVCSDLYNLSHDDLKQRYFVDDDLLDEKLSLSKQDIVKHNNDSNMIKQILYRPFSIKYTFYSGLSSGLVNRPRNNVMKHLLYSNIGLIVSKINRQLSLGYCFVTSMLTDLHILDVARDSTYLFPLYLYEEVDFLGETQLEKKPNIKAEIIAELTAKYKQQATGAVGTSVPASSNTGGTPVSTLSPEQIMSYIYAVLHSPTYRSKYADFLKTDFPRIPFTDDYKVFEGLSGLGWDLMQAHLQKKDELSKLYPGCGDFAVKGNNTVDKVLYTEAQSRLYINTDQYFANVPSEVYSFYIGGYQVLHKYLKDRKGRMLTLDEINNVESVVKILLFTIEQMQKIDTLTQDWI